MGAADKAVTRTDTGHRAARRVCAQAAVLGIGACLAAVTAPGVSANKRAGSCPRQASGALPLGSGAIGKARKAALAAAPKLYKGLDVEGAKVVSAKVASAAGPRGGEVAYQCGKTVQARTIVVELDFPKEHPSASLSEGVVFVSRFTGGFKVWEVAH